MIRGDHSPRWLIICKSFALIIIDGATAASPSCNTNPLNMTAEEYFDENYDKDGKKVMMIINEISGPI